VQFFSSQEHTPALSFGQLGEGVPILLYKALSGLDLIVNGGFDSTQVKTSVPAVCQIHRVIRPYVQYAQNFLRKREANAIVDFMQFEFKGHRTRK